MQQPLARKQRNKHVRHGRAVARARVQLLGKDVEGLRVGAEEGQVEDGLGLGEVEGGEVGIEARGGGAEVGDWERGLVLCVR